MFLDSLKMSKKAKAELIFTVVSYSRSLLPCRAGNQTCVLKYPLSLLRSSVSEQQRLEPCMLVTASSHRTSRCRGKDRQHRQHRHETRTKTQKARFSLKLAARVLLCFLLIENCKLETTRSARLPIHGIEDTSVELMVKNKGFPPPSENQCSSYHNEVHPGPVSPKGSEASGKVTINGIFEDCHHPLLVKPAAVN